MRKKYKKPTVTKRHADPFAKTDYRGTTYKEAPPKTIVPLAPLVSTKEWIVSILISIIPLVNLIAFAAWSKKSTMHISESRKNWAKASFIVWLVIYIVAAAVIAILYLAFPKVLGLST